MATIYPGYKEPSGAYDNNDRTLVFRDSKKVGAPRQPIANGAVSRSVERRAKRRAALIEELLILGGLFFLTFFAVQTSLPMGS